MTEHELGNAAKNLLRDNKNVFVLCSSTNIDTIAGFYNAAIVNKKPFIVCEDDFQNEILRIVTAASKSPFYDFSRRKIYNFGENEKLLKYMSDCGFCFIGRTNYLTQKAMAVFNDNLLIYSMWKGYLDKTHPAFDQYKSGFIEKATAAGSKLLYLHTSGHSTSNDRTKASSTRCFPVGISQKIKRFLDDNS